MRVPHCSCCVFEGSTDLEQARPRFLGSLVSSLADVVSEMPVAHLSTELCVLCVLSFGHFFWVWVPILPWLVVFQIHPLLFAG